MFRPQGVYVAMMTPFREDGTVDEEVLRDITEFLIEKGVHGLFPVSSVGEGVHLLHEEKILVMKAVAEEAKGRVPVTPGVGTTNPAYSLVLAAKARELGCQAAVVAPPYFYPISEAMVEAYFHRIVRGSPIPIIVYNIPLFTQPISATTLGRLSLDPNVVALKESSGSMVQFLHFIDEVRKTGGDIAFLAGREDMFFPALVMGAEGCMVATAGFLPEVILAIYRSWQQGKWERAKRLQMEVVSIVRLCFSVAFPIGFKLAMECRGFKMGPPKQPVSESESKKLEELKEALKVRLGEVLAQVREEA